MKNTKIVLVAAWDGWCGPCAVERPLVLTRSGRLGLRTWLTVPVVDERPLTLTCRLCGSSAVVPPEEDDPPVLVPPDEAPTAALPPATPATPALAAGTAPVAPAVAPPLAPATLPPVAPPASATAPVDDELAQARGALGTALRALLAGRTAQIGHIELAPALAPEVSVAPAPALPLQRTASSDSDGTATLQLLASGLDLLSSSRS